jgi:hypothetical protein
MDTIAGMTRAEKTERQNAGRQYAILFCTELLMTDLILIIAYK